MIPQVKEDPSGTSTIPFPALGGKATALQSNQGYGKGIQVHRLLRYKVRGPYVSVFVLAPDLYLKKYSFPMKDWVHPKLPTSSLTLWGCTQIFHHVRFTVDTLHIHSSTEPNVSTEPYMWKGISLISGIQRIGAQSKDIQ